MVYTDYFQKSKLFLYPLLGIKKGVKYVPSKTYVCWKDLYTSKDYKFICVYEVERGTDFKNFALRYLKSNIMFNSEHEFENKQVYVFDLSIYKQDYEAFILGKYSKISEGSKKRILSYFTDKEKSLEYVKGFLNPSDYHQLYAEKLGVDIKIIKETYEVCSKPNMIKETFVEKKDS